MTVLLVAGSPSGRSRSAGLLDAAAHSLAQQGHACERLQIRELDPEALLLADGSHPDIARAIAQVARAKALVVATPIYKAAYSGVLKVFLDLLPQSALQGKSVLPLATGGSAHHMLALDYALRPVLQSLSARHILPGIYATDALVSWAGDGSVELAPEIAARLDAALETLAAESGLARAPAGAFRPVRFTEVQCSF